MAHRPRRRAVARKRSRKGFMVWPVQVQLALSTLGGGTVISAALLTLDEDAFFISADLSWSMRDHTATEGPIVVGLAHGDLAVAEIAEAIVASPTHPGDIIAMERARRPVRNVGQLPGLNTEEVLNHGDVKRSPIKFRVDDTTTLNIWAQNQSGASLTTGTILEVSGVIYGRWEI